MVPKLFHMFANYFLHPNIHSLFFYFIKKGNVPAFASIDAYNLYYYYFAYYV
jgi:hypothetical protein